MSKTEITIRKNLIIEIVHPDCIRVVGYADGHRNNIQITVDLDYGVKIKEGTDE